MAQVQFMIKTIIDMEPICYKNVKEGLYLIDEDGNILNNNYKNLEWVERGYNSSIRNNKGAGENNHEAKLNKNQVKEICELLINTDMSFDEIATNYNISKSVISSIKRQVSWKTITTQYDFSCRINIRDELGRFKNINTKFHPEYIGD